MLAGVHPVPVDGPVGRLWRRETNQSKAKQGNTETTTSDAAQSKAEQRMAEHCAESNQEECKPKQSWETKTKANKSKSKERQKQIMKGNARGTLRNPQM